MMVFIIDLTVVCDVDVDADAMRALSLSTIPKFSLSCKSKADAVAKRSKAFEKSKAKGPHQGIQAKAVKTREAS